MALYCALHRELRSSILYRILNVIYAVPHVFSVPIPFPSFQLFCIWWSLTKLRHAASRMVPSSDKRITTIRYLSFRANLLPSNDVPPASGDHSTSENTLDLSAPKAETTAESRRKRRYSDIEGNGRTAGSADRKRLASTRPGVGHDTREAERHLSPSTCILLVYVLLLSTGKTARKDGATAKLNGNIRIRAEAPE